MKRGQSSLVEGSGKRQEGLSNAEIAQQFIALKTEAKDNIAVRAFLAEFFDSLNDDLQRRLLQCMRAGRENLTVGCFATHAKDYEDFKPYFAEVLAQIHGGPVTAPVHNWDVTTVASAPAEGKLDLGVLGLPVRMVRIEVARNLKNYPLSANMTKQQRLDLEDELQPVFDALSAEFGGRYVSLTPGHPKAVSPGERQHFVDSNPLFKPGAESASICSDWPVGRGVFSPSNNSVSVWVGGEDHLRIIVSESSDLSALLERLRSVTETLASLITGGFAHSPEFGVVTSCPSKLGTALRASVQIALPALITRGNVVETVLSQHHLKMSEADADHTVQIYFPERFGVSEAESVCSLFRGVEELVTAERASPVRPLQAPGRRVVQGVAMPLVLQCAPLPLEQALDWVSAHLDRLEALLLIHGGIFFRGFPLTTAQDFDRFIERFTNWHNLPYEESLSFAVRLHVVGRVCTTNEGKRGGMVFHHEQAQTPLWPSKIMFYCETPATVGGGTGLCASSEVLERLEQKFPDFVRKVEALGVRYSSYMRYKPDASKGVGRGWREFFGKVVESWQDAEARMTELGYSWEWQDQEHDLLRCTSPCLQAVRVAPGTQTRVYFNQLPATLANAKEWTGVADMNAFAAPGCLDRFLTFGDGSAFTADDCAALLYSKACTEDVAIDIPYEAGDVALLDNYLMMHARREYEGPRRVLASLFR